MSAKTLGRGVVRGLFTAALLAVVVLLGQVPYSESGQQAVVRLALRAVKLKAEICRDRTAEELAELPAHMRQPRTCETVAPDYRLRVSLEGRLLLDREARPGGLKSDRPMIVDEQLLVTPGRASLEVQLEPLLEPETVELLARSDASMPSYRLRSAVELRANRITLVVLDEDAGRLRLVE